MTMLDPAEVRSFVADLDARMNRCDNGEGMECAGLDDALRHCAALCCEFREGVRRWGRAVFADRVAFDPQVEKIWLDEGKRLYSRALEMSAYGRAAEKSCFALDGQAVLESALWNLDLLLRNWVTPKSAVGPSARQGLTVTPEVSEAIRRRIDALPPLPEDWKPSDMKQQKQFEQFRRGRIS